MSRCARCGHGGLIHVGGTGGCLYHHGAPGVETARGGTCDCRGFVAARLPTHPSEVLNALAIAHGRTTDLITQAEARGDVGGADAWRIALDAIDHAERTFDEMRSKQDWSMRAEKAVAR